MSLKCGIVGLPNVGKIHPFQRLDPIGHRGRPIILSAPSSPMWALWKCPTPRMAALAKNCESAKKCSRRLWNLSTLPAWWQARARARAWATSFLANIRENRCDCKTWCAALTTTTSCMWPAKSTRLPTSKTIGTELALADLASVEKSHCPRRQARQIGRQRSAKAGGAV
jgi:hypothetical protein